MLVDGHSVGELGSDGPHRSHSVEEFCQLALLPGDVLHPLPQRLSLGRPCTQARIENFVLIREADLAFGPALNAVTGETGKQDDPRAGDRPAGRRVTPVASAPAPPRRTWRQSSTRRTSSSTASTRLLSSARGRGGSRRRARRVFADGRTRVRVGAGGPAGRPRHARRAAHRHVRSVRAAAPGRPRSSWKCSTRSSATGRCGGGGRHDARVARAPSRAGGAETISPRPRRVGRNASPSSGARRPHRGPRARERGCASVRTRAPPSRHRARRGQPRRPQKRSRPT